MRTGDFEFLSELLARKSGLELTPEKAYLLENRLTPVARKRSMGGLGNLIEALRAGRDEMLVVEVVEAMTTRDSYFFRDVETFRVLRESVLPHLLVERARARRLRIWTAACSTGQEPYSIAMVLAELHAMLAGWSVEIVATDISRDAIERGGAGLYNPFEVQRGLPIRWLLKYFRQRENNQWQIVESLRGKVRFHEANLLSDLTAMGTFDLIMCRNVFSQFGRSVRSTTLERIAAQLNPGGFLVLGSGETGDGAGDRFQPAPGLECFFSLAGPDGRSAGGGSGQVNGFGTPQVATA